MCEEEQSEELERKEERCRGSLMKLDTGETKDGAG